MEQSRQVGKGWQVPFFSVWVGQVFSLLGSSLVQFALVWRLTKSTGSATVLAMATLMAVLPSVFLSPFAGALVDRWNRRVVMMVADGLILGLWGGFRRRILTSMMGLTGVGLGFLLVGLAPSAAFVLAVGAMFLAGVMNPITNGPIFSILQSSVDPGMQGRVFALVQSMATAATPLGMLIAGPVADALGVRVWYGVGGLGCLLMGLGSFFVPAIVHLEDERDASVREASSVAPVTGGAADAAQPVD